MHFGKDLYNAAAKRILSLANRPRLCYNQSKETGKDNETVKKAFFFCTAVGASLLLTACEANWFGETVDVPWYFIAIPLCLVIVISYLVLMNTTFVCPSCEAEFKPKWYQLSVGIHHMNKRLLKCPKCGKRSFCKRK